MARRFNLQFILEPLRVAHVRQALPPGIYSSPGVLSYVVKGSKLDTNVELGLGTHRVVVEEWDKLWQFVGSYSHSHGSRQGKRDIALCQFDGFEPGPLRGLREFILF